MTTAVFDTLAFSKRLKAAGFTESQAEAQAEAMAEIIDEKLATKKDLLELEARLNQKIEELSYKLTIRLGFMLVASITILSAIIKLH